MEKRLIHSTSTPKLSWIYLATVFQAFHYFFVIYINSSSLSRFVSPNMIGFFYVLGAGLTIALLVLAPRLIEKVGARTSMLSFIIAEAISLLGLAFSTNGGFFLLFFIIHQSIPPILLFHLDIFLERATKNKETGRARGMYMTVINGIVIICPILVGTILALTSFRTIYLISFIFLIPLFLITLRLMRRDKGTTHKQVHLSKSIATFFSTKNIVLIGISNFFLQLFYATMVIYMPIYLTSVIGLPWSSIGIIFTIMLIPFVLDEAPLGRLADRYIGEKEILIAGFVIMAASTIALTRYGSPSIIIWALLLFATRIGASFVEIGTETYFFKQIKSKNADIVGLYRMTVPLAFIVVPIFAFITLSTFTMQSMFFTLGIAMLIGALSSALLKDTL